MAASNPPKGSVSSSSIQAGYAQGRAFASARSLGLSRRRRAGSWRPLRTSTRLRRALCWQRRWILCANWSLPHRMPAATSTTRMLWRPTCKRSATWPSCPAAPNALSDAGYMFTLSGADLIRDIYTYCSELAERHVFDAAEVKPGYVIKLVLRLFLMDGFAAMPA